MIRESAGNFPNFDRFSEVRFHPLLFSFKNKILFLCFFRLLCNSQVLNMISLERAFFVAETAGECWLPAHVTQACEAYNRWRHNGAIRWPTVDVQDLISLIRQAPNMHDPILRGPQLGSFQTKAGPKLNQESQHVKEKGRPNTRGARKGSVPAAARQRVQRQQWLGGAAAERQRRRGRGSYKR